MDNKVGSKKERMESVKSLVDGVIIPTDRIVEAMELLIRPGIVLYLKGIIKNKRLFIPISCASGSKKFMICI